MNNKALSMAAILLAVASVSFTAATGAYAKNGKNKNSAAPAAVETSTTGQNTHEHDDSYEDSHSNDTGNGHENHQGHGYGHHKGTCTDGELASNGLGLGHKKDKGNGHENHQGNGYGHDKFGEDGDCGGNGGNGGNGGIGRCVATTQMTYSLDTDAGTSISFPYYYTDSSSTDPLPLFPDDHMTSAYTSVMAKGSLLQITVYAPEGQNISDIQMSVDGQTLNWNDDDGFASGGENVSVQSNTNQTVKFLFNGLSGTGNFDFQVTICSEDGSNIDPS